MLATLPALFPGRRLQAQNFPALTPLDSTLACHRVNVHSKGLTDWLTPLLSTLTKTSGDFRPSSETPLFPSRPRQVGQGLLPNFHFRFSIFKFPLPISLRSFISLTSSTSFTSSSTQERLHPLCFQQLARSFRHNRGVPLDEQLSGIFPASSFHKPFRRGVNDLSSSVSAASALSAPQQTGYPSPPATSQSRVTGHQSPSFTGRRSLATGHFLLTGRFLSAAPPSAPSRSPPRCASHDRASSRSPVSARTCRASAASLRAPQCPAPAG